MGIPVSKSQDIGDDGLDILSRQCTTLGFSYRNMPIKDVGIDGEIELRNNGEYNDKFQVQVKTSEKFVLKDGKLKIRQIDRGHLEYWNNDINLPVFIMAVEINTNRVFWIDTRPYYEKIKKNLKQKTIFIYADINNELIKDNKEDFINFTKELDKYNAEKTLIKSSHLEKLRIIGNRKGYKTIEDKANNSLQLVHTKNSRDNIFEFNGLIDKKINSNKFEISKFSLNLGKENIFKNMKGTIELLELKEDIQIGLSTKTQEYIVNVERYKEGNYTFLQSKEGEIIKLKSKFNNKTFNLEDSSLEFNIDFEKEENLIDIYDILCFFNESKENFTLSFINKKGKKEPVLAGRMNKNYIIDTNFLYNFIGLLIDLEKKLKISFSPNSIFNGEINYKQMQDLIPFLKAIIDGEYILKGKSTLKFTPKNKNKELFKKEKIAIRQSYNHFSVFDIDLDININIELEGDIKKEKNNFLVSTNSVRFFIGK